MNETPQQPGPSSDVIDAIIFAQSGPEPPFDSVVQDFLKESYLDLHRHCERGGLLQVANLGTTYPWLFRLTFSTKGFVRSPGGHVTTIDGHVVALRFPPDYLRHANRFDMLQLVGPRHCFHPNIDPLGRICVQIYPGESLVEICQSLHDLFRWRLRQYDERDALNPDACAWGRQNVDRPIDDRPLFGKRLTLQWQAASSLKDGTP